MAHTSHGSYTENTTAKQIEAEESRKVDVSNADGEKDTEKVTQTGQSAASSTRKPDTKDELQEAKVTEDRGEKERQDKTEEELQKNKKSKVKKRHGDGDKIEGEKKDEEDLEEGGLRDKQQETKATVDGGRMIKGRTGYGAGQGQGEEVGEDKRRHGDGDKKEGKKKDKESLEEYLYSDEETKATDDGGQRRTGRIRYRARKGKELEEGGEEALKDKAKIYKYKKVLVVLVVLAVPIISAVILQCFYHKEDLTTPLESVKVFSDSFIQLQASFPQQTPRFWRILRNRATAHLKNPNPKKPLVFMLTAGPSAHDVLECIARKLAQSLDYEDNGIGDVNSGDYRQYSSLDEAKEKLDKTLDEMLQKGRTVLIFNVDRLPVQSPLLFYQYCDNENAPYKRAAIVFTVRLPAKPDPSLEPAKEEGLVAKYLRETWGKQDYRPDDIPPLVSRMTDTVVMVKQERNDIVEQHCDI